ncbi:MAG: histidine kinase dimerization/phospho-acceptor domain-containing protein, partial [Chloroflexota bacterium]
MDELHSQFLELQPILERLSPTLAGWAVLTGADLAHQACSAAYETLLPEALNAAGLPLAEAWPHLQDDCQILQQLDEARTQRRPLLIDEFAPASAGRPGLQGQFLPLQWQSAPSLLALLWPLAADSRAGSKLPAEARIQQLENELAALRSANRELQDFVFSAAHDMQEPLRKIEAFGSALLKDRQTLNENQFNYLERMRSAAARLRALLDDLLALARLERDIQPFQLLDLTELAQ